MFWPKMNNHKKCSFPTIGSEVLEIASLKLYLFYREGENKRGNALHWKTMGRALSEELLMVNIKARDRRQLMETKSLNTLLLAGTSRAPYQRNDSLLTALLMVSGPVRYV